MVVDEDGFRTLPRSRCLELLGTARVGRLGLSVAALPVILPVNYAMAGERVVFRSVPGTKLDSALASAVVAFEVDAHGQEGAWGWSVLVQGVAHEIIVPAELEVARRLPLRAWAYPDAAERWVMVQSTFVSGRCFGRLPD